MRWSRSRWAGRRPGGRPGYGRSSRPTARAARTAGRRPPRWGCCRTEPSWGGVRPGTRATRVLGPPYQAAALAVWTVPTASASFDWEGGVGVPEHLDRPRCLSDRTAWSHPGEPRLDVQ